MNPFREYLANAKAAKYLRPRYYLLTTGVGLVAVAAGLVAWYLFFEFIAGLVGIPLDQPARDSSGGGWLLAWLVVGIPLTLYGAGVMVAGVVGIALAVFGAVSAGEALSYALLSRYPRSWFKASGDA